MTLTEFRRTYPAATFTVSGGKPFTYRYHQNPQAKATLVLLTGGIGPTYSISTLLGSLGIFRC